MFTIKGYDAADVSLPENIGFLEGVNQRLFDALGNIDKK